MAETERQSDETENDQSPARTGPGVLTWIIVAGVAMLAGAAVPLSIQTLMPAEEPVRGPEEAARQALDDEPAFIPFGEVVVNLDDGRLNRYLRLNLTLQVNAEHVEEVTTLIESRNVLLKNWLLSHLSDKDMDEIRGAVGQNRLRREIRDEFNTVLFPDGYDRIHDVLFVEFNVQ